MTATFGESDLQALQRLNRLRRDGDAADRERLERWFRRRFGAHHRLAVYGTLAPGRSNHHQLAGLAGTWRSDLIVRGELAATGWGAQLGFPALRWDPEGPPVAVALFVSPDLPGHWPRLDVFEGAGYVRILVPLLAQDRVIAVANLYEAAG